METENNDEHATANHYLHADPDSDRLSRDSIKAAGDNSDGFLETWGVKCFGKFEQRPSLFVCGNVIFSNTELQLI